MLRQSTANAAPQHILMITALFIPVAGGTEQQALALSRALHARGLSVCILTRSLKGLPSHENIDGIEIFRAIRTLPLPLLFGLTYFFSTMKFILKHRNSFSLIHCHILQNYHSIAAVLAKCLFGKKVIIKVAATGDLSDLAIAKKSLLGSFFLSAVRHADCFIALCSQAEKEILAAGIPKQQIVKIPNGVDTVFFKPAEAACQPPFKLLFIGRLDYMKGVDVLIDSIALLKTENQAVTCAILGDGPVKASLQEKAEELGVSHMAEFIGASPDVVTFLHAADCLVLPSRSEGMPNVILEAMACGLPIIATSVGGIPDILHDGGNSLLIAPNDARALCDAVVQLICKPELAARLGRKARNDAEERFSIDKIAAAYGTLYDRILEPGH